jgi:hypothetical protein
MASCCGLLGNDTRTPPHQIGALPTGAPSISPFLRGPNLGGAGRLRELGRARLGHFVPKRASMAAPPLFQTSYGLSRDAEADPWDNLSLRAAPRILCNLLYIIDLPAFGLASRLPIKGQATKDVLCVYSNAASKHL